jgi:hypothetical protein
MDEPGLLKKSYELRVATYNGHSQLVTFLEQSRLIV